MKKLFGGALTWAYVALVVLPLVWVLVASLKGSGEIFRSPWSLPTTWHFENYANVWGNSRNPVGEPFLTSLGVSFATLFLLLPVGSMAAYVLARHKFRGSGAVLTLFLAGMMVPNLLAAVPLRMLASETGLYDTYWGLILVYTAYSLGFTVFVMHGFFTGLPGELAEAARMDGAGHSTVFSKVMMPLARPGLIVVGIFNGIGLWNEYNLARIFLTKEHYTLPLALANLVGQGVYDSNYGEIFAAMVMVMAPVLVVYWVFKERIQQAMLAGAVK